MNRDDEDNTRQKRSKSDAIKGQSQSQQLPTPHALQLTEGWGKATTCILCQIVSDQQADLWKIKGGSGMVTATINSLSDPKGT